MAEIIDLSQEIYSGMPVFKGLPPVSMEPYATHEEWLNIPNPTTHTPSVHTLTFSEHTGTHVDAINHMGISYAGQSIDTMPLSMFYTSGFCIDLSYKQAGELIEPEDLEKACAVSKQIIQPGDTLLIYTDHYRKHFGGDHWINNPGLSAAAAYWLGNHKIAAFGVESMSPGVPKVSNRQVHEVCGQLGFTHYENMINLHLLIGRGRFRFIALPLKIRGGTGSPVRAIAVFE